MKISSLVIKQLKMFHKCKYVLMNELVQFYTFILNYKRIINELNLFEKFFDSKNVSMHCLCIYEYIQCRL